MSEEVKLRNKKSSKERLYLVFRLIAMQKALDSQGFLHELN